MAIVKYFLFMILFGVSFGTGYFGLKYLFENNSQSAVLSVQTEGVEQLTPTVTPIPTKTPSPTLTPTPTIIPSQTPTPTPTPIPQPEFSSEQINSFIDRFAGQYGVDPHVLRHIAICESGFNPHATKLSYVGLYQFTDFTWEKYRKQIGEDPDPNLRANAEEAVQAAAYVLSIGDTHIWPSCVP